MLGGRNWLIGRIVVEILRSPSSRGLEGIGRVICDILCNNLCNVVRDITCWGRVGVRWVIGIIVSWWAVAGLPYRDRHRSPRSDLLTRASR